MKVALPTVQETLLLPLLGRARATTSGSRILVDRRAVEIVSRIDGDLERIERAISMMGHAQWAASSKQFDLLLEEYLSAHPSCTVVDLGAGLDTAFDRNDNGTVRWVNLDLPEVVALRRELIPDTPRSTCIARSALDLRWMDEIGQVDSGLFVMSNSALLYLEEADIRSLFRALHDRFAGTELAFGAMSQEAAGWSNRMIRNAGMSGSRIRWTIDAPETIDSWDCGLEVTEWFSLFRGIPRAGLGWKARLLMRFLDWKKAYTIVRCRI